MPIILIGHQNTLEGKRRTRRLFSTLNRRAKRVNENEIIALDEDDLVAITTREIAENHKLFSGERLVDCATKNIPSTNNIAFTSILTLYEITKIIYTEKCLEKGISKAKQEKALLYRPSDDVVEEFILEVNKFWDTFMTNIPSIKEYISIDIQNLDHKYRSVEGGNLYLDRLRYHNLSLLFLNVKRECR